MTWSGAASACASAPCDHARVAAVRLGAWESPLNRLDFGLKRASRASESLPKALFQCPEVSFEDWRSFALDMRAKLLAAIPLRIAEIGAHMAPQGCEVRS